MHRKSLFTLTALVFLVGFATAQSVDAPPLSPEMSTLYAHHATSDTVELEGWANTLETDGDDTAMGPSASCTQHSGDKAVDDVILTAAGTAMDRTYTLQLLPAQAGMITLDAAKIVSNVYVGAGSCFGKIDITSTLLAGEVKVAEGKATGHWYDNTAALYPGVKIEADVLVTEVDASTLVWKINLKGKTGGAAFMGVSKEKGTTSIALPILAVGGGAPSTVFVELQGDAAQDTFELENKTTRTTQYNWTSPGGDATITLTGELTDGSVRLVVMGGGKEEANSTWNGTIDETVEFSSTAGPYTIQILFEQAQGSLAFALAVAAPASAETTTPSEDANATTGATDNATGEAKDTDGEGVPVPAAAAILAPLGALLLRRRRA